MFQLLIFCIILLVLKFEKFIQNLVKFMSFLI